MNPEDIHFLAHLAEALAHSVVFFEKEVAGDSWGLLRADLNINPGTGAPRKAGEESDAQMRAELDRMPEQYAADAEFRPKYLGMDLDMLDTAMPRLVDAMKRNQPGLSDLAATSASAQRGADIADVARLGPAARDAFRAANPEQTRLMDRLNTSAMEGLDAGGGLTPSESRSVSETAGAAGASRGLGFGPSDVYADTLAQDSSRNAMLQQRQQFGTQIAGLNQATGSDPFLQVLGRPSQVPGMAAGLLGTGTGIAGGGGPKLTDPFSAYGADLANTNYNADAAARIARSNNSAAIMGSAMSY